MPSHLYQLEISYHQQQDRLILKMFTHDLAEYRFWLTRYFVKGLWGVLNKLLETESKDAAVHAKEKQEVAEKYSTEQKIRQPAASKYSTKLSKTPLGEVPLLLVGVSADISGTGALLLNLQLENGQTVEISANSKTILSLQKLLVEITHKADWKLDLEE